MTGSRAALALSCALVVSMAASLASAQDTPGMDGEAADASGAEAGEGSGYQPESYGSPGRVGDISPAQGVDRHALSGTPYTIGDRKWFVGFTRLGYGVSDRLDVFTTYWLWGLLSPNGSFRWRFHQRERFSAAVGLGFGYFNVNFISNVFGDFLGEDDSAGVYTVPIKVSAAWTFRNGDSLAFNLSRLNVYGDLEVEGLGGGGVATSLSSWGFNWVNRTRRRLQMELRGLVGRSANVRAAASSDSYDADDDTTVTVNAESQLDASEYLGYSFSYNFVWRYDRLHLGLGLSYGNTLGFGLPIKITEPRLVPTVELYWVF